MRKFDKRTNKVVDNDIFYYMLKKFHCFFTKNYESIFDGQIYIHKLQTKWTKDEIRKYLFSLDEDLKNAYFLKERYREFNSTADYPTCDVEFEMLIQEFLNHPWKAFRDFGALLHRWKPYIKNSFLRVNHRRLSNGPIEGVNSKIKTIMKSANG